MKKINDFKIGDKVTIVSKEELNSLLDIYEFDSIDEIFELANEQVYLVQSIDRLNINTDNLDGKIKITTKDNKEYRIPIAAIADEPINISINIPSNRVVRDVKSEQFMIRQLAAETIQNAFKNYKQKKKNNKQTNVLVNNLAADMIQKFFRKSTTKLKKKQEIVHDDNIFKDNLVINIKSIHAKNLYNVTWNGVNDPYVIITCISRDYNKENINNLWKYRTITIHDTTNTVNWENINVSIPLSILHRNINYDVDFIEIDIFHENLVRDDQLIGRKSIAVESFTSSSSPLDESIYIETKNGETKRGDINIFYDIAPGIPTKSNYISNKKSKSDIHSYLTVHPTINTINILVNQPEIPIDVKSKSKAFSKLSNEIFEKQSTSDIDSKKSTPRHKSKPPLNKIKSWTSETTRTSISSKKDRSNKFSNSTTTNIVSNANQLDNKVLKKEKSQMFNLYIDEAFQIAKQKYLNIISLTSKDLIDILIELDLQVQLNNNDSNDRIIDLPIINSRPLAAILSKYLSNTITKDQSIKIITYINNKLLSNWIKIRKFILFNTGKSIRPSDWNSQIVRQLNNLIIEINNDNSDNNKNEVNDKTLDVTSGYDFIYNNNNHFNYNLKSIKLSMYKYLIQLLDKWLEKSIFPSDIFKANNKIYNSLVKTNRDSKVDDEIDKKSNEWGNVSKSSKSSVLEISNFDKLLDMYISFSRTYGWNISVDILTAISKYISNELCQLDICNFDDLIEFKGCRWIELSNEDTNKLLSENFNKSNIPIISTSASSSSTSHISLLVPLLCLRNHFKSIQSNNSLSHSQCKLGKIVKIANQEVIEKAISVYDWWDQPPKDQIQRMANNKAEIISINELYSKNRVGVRVLKLNIYDALPISCIYNCSEVDNKVDIKRNNKSDFKIDGTIDSQIKIKRKKKKKMTSNPINYTKLYDKLSDNNQISSNLQDKVVMASNNIIKSISKLNSKRNSKKSENKLDNSLIELSKASIDYIPDDSKSIKSLRKSDSFDHIPETKEVWLDMSPPHGDESFLPPTFASDISSDVKITAKVDNRSNKDDKLYDDKSSSTISDLPDHLITKSSDYSWLNISKTNPIISITSKFPSKELAKDVTKPGIVLSTTQSPTKLSIKSQEFDIDHAHYYIGSPVKVIDEKLDKHKKVSTSLLHSKPFVLNHTTLNNNVNNNLSKSIKYKLKNNLLDLTDDCIDISNDLLPNKIADIKNTLGITGRGINNATTGNDSNSQTLVIKNKPIINNTENKINNKVTKTIKPRSNIKDIIDPNKSIEINNGLGIIGSKVGGNGIENKLFDRITYTNIDVEKNTNKTNDKTSDINKDKSIVKPEKKIRPNSATNTSVRNRLYDFNISNDDQFNNLLSNINNNNGEDKLNNQYIKRELQKSYKENYRKQLILNKELKRNSNIN